MCRPNRRAKDSRGHDGLFVLAHLAGTNGVVPYGISRLFASVAFCLGPILVVIGRAKLFTGNP